MYSGPVPCVLQQWTGIKNSFSVNLCTWNEKRSLGWLSGPFDHDISCLSEFWCVKKLHEIGPRASQVWIPSELPVPAFYVLQLAILDSKLSTYCPAIYISSRAILMDLVFL